MHKRIVETPSGVSGSVARTALMMTSQLPFKALENCIVNRDSKRINPSCRPQIERTKGHIRNSNGRWFDADGYIGKTAIKEVRLSGIDIEYCRNRGSYRLINSKVPSTN